MKLGRLAVLAVMLSTIALVASQGDDEFEDEFEVDTEGTLLNGNDASTATSASAAVAASSNEGSTSPSSASSATGSTAPKTFTDYPWDLGAVGFVLLYVVYYIIGRSQNSSKVKAFTETFRSHLRDQFAMVGQGDVLFNRDTDSDFSCWCTGRKNIKGALVQLQLSKRQDLYDTVMSMVGTSDSSDDRVIIDAVLDEDKGPEGILCIVPTKERKSLKDTRQDLALCDVEKKGSGHGLDNMEILSEHSSMFMDILGEKAVELFAKYSKTYFKGFHFTDLPGRAGFATERLPGDSNRTIRFTLALPSRDLKLIEPLMEQIWIIIDRIATVKLRKDANSSIEHHRNVLMAALQKKQKEALEERQMEEDIAKEKEERRKELARLDAMTPEQRQKELARQQELRARENMKKMKKQAKSLAAAGIIK